MTPTTIRSLVRRFFDRALSLSAGEGDSKGPDTTKMPLGKVGDVRDEEPMLPAGDEGGDDGDDDDGGQRASAPGNAGKTADDDADDDSDDGADDGDGGDEPGGESDAQGASASGEGADDDDDGTDPAVILSIQRNWESRFEASGSDKGEPDHLAMVKAHKFAASDTLKAKVRKAFEEERDVDAIIDIVSEAIPSYLKAYDDSRINPTLTEQQVQLRTQRIVGSIRAFDEAHPGARSQKITEKMAALYDQYKEKYGYKKADSVPVEDYFIMAGGRFKKGPKAAGGKTQAAPTKQDQEERRKAAALAASQQPERVGKKAPVGSNKKKGSEADDVEKFSKTIGATRFDPFVIR